LPQPLGVLGALADNTNPASLAARLRRQRTALMLSLLPPTGHQRIVDLGGEARFWTSYVTPEQLARLDIVCVNKDEQQGANGRPGISVVVGDARRLPQFGDNHFDLAVSNSVIEHVGDFEDQRAMAGEVRRLAPRYWVQTPNYWFPIEPHMLCPGFQYLPETAKRWLAPRWRLGWRDNRVPGLLEDTLAIRLLSARELKQLFPDAQIRRERVLGIAKSLIAVRGVCGKN
jgi:hypothetical protein